MLKNISVSRRAILLSSTAAAMMSMSLSQTAIAQDDVEEVEEVVVTGSRIVRKDLVSASPVTVIGAEEVSLSGSARIEDLVQELPQAFNAQNSTVANGSSGTATVDLRNLGSQRTLVLVNGRRLMPGDPQSPSADLNNIPSALVKRVEVLTGGASAVYGADAVAGVVNFVLDTDFEGIQGGVNYSTYQHNNRNEAMQAINEAKGFDVPKGNMYGGATKTFNIALGSEFGGGKGHASAYMTYRDIEQLTKSQYDFTNCTVSAGSSGPRCGGSSTTPWGTFNVPTVQFAGRLLGRVDGAGDPILDPDSGLQFMDPVIDPDTGLQFMDPIQLTQDVLDEFGEVVLDVDGNAVQELSFDADGRPSYKTKTKGYLVDPETGDFIPRTGQVFNYGPFNHIQRPDETFTAGSFINYELSDQVEAYMEFMFMDNKSDAQIAPSGNFYRTSTIKCDNPMLSAAQVKTICTDNLYGEGTDYNTAKVSIGRRNIEGGPRTSKMRHTNYRMLAGFRGDINDTWSYDAYGLYATSLYSSMYINDLNTNRIKDALDVVLADDGSMVCASGNEGCAPWNIFTKGGVTQEALDYIQTTAVAKGWTKTQVVSASFTGDLGDYGMKLPGAEEGIAVAMGLEYRSESLGYEPDEVFSKGLRAGSGGASPPLEGGFDVKEIFAEALIPLVQGKDMAQDLTLELAGRYSEYNLSGGKLAYKAQISYSPTNDVRLRAGYNRAVRAPNPVELFDPQGYGLGGDNDICGGETPSFTAAQCANTGVSASQYGNVLKNEANQYNTLGGGNPNLKPETADTYTIGLVITPEALPGFSATLDWYDIKISDVVGVLGADDVIQACALTGDADLCSKIHRDDFGTLWIGQEGYTETFRDNVGELRSQGIDVNLNYLADMGDVGSLRFAMVGTYLLKHNFANPLTDYDCVGYFGGQCGTPMSKWRHKLRVTWDTSFDTTISLAWRYTGAVTIDDLSPDEDIANPADVAKWEANDVAQVSGKSFFDLAFTYDLTENVIITGGINNLLDSEPPIFPSISSTGFANTYDTRGRKLFLGAKFNF